MAKIEQNDKIIKTNLGKTTPNLSEAVENDFKIQSYTKELSHAVDEILIKENKKAPINSFKIGELSDFVKEKIKEILGMNLENK